MQNVFTTLNFAFLTLNSFKEVFKMDRDRVAEAGFGCFGRIAASVSHELKNVLAIINENAGLLEDIIFMSEKGMPFDPVRLKLLAETISGQVYRGSDILRNLNRFAHTTDEPVKMIDVAETVSLMTALCDRFAVMRNVSLNMTSPEQAVVVSTHVFIAETLIYRCLKFAIDGLSKGHRIEIRTEKTDQGARIHFLTSEQPGGIFPAAEEKELSEMLNAKLSFSGKEIILEIV
jgi:light-regulated signal transduction histidine kinase (bacteriophytochrome)